MQLLLIGDERPAGETGASRRTGGEGAGGGSLRHSGASIAFHLCHISAHNMRALLRAGLSAALAKVSQSS
jgi:hypothetical protein